MRHDEAKLQRDVLAFLGSRKDTLVYRVHIAPVINPRTGQFHASSSAPKGHPDVLCCIRGRYVALELKAPDGRQKPDQRAFQAAVERAGGEYHLVRELAQVEGVVERLEREAEWLRPMPF